MRRPLCAVFLGFVAGIAHAGPAACWWDDPLFSGPPATIAPGQDGLWFGPAHLADLTDVGAAVWYAVDPNEEAYKAAAIYLPVPLLRSRLFDPALIGVVAREVGVDPALAAGIVSVESGFNPRAVSVTGARGLMQLTSRTARSLGVYNRFSPRWNLKGGIRYLKHLLSLYGGDVPLAVAAYTLGPTGMERELGRDSSRASGHPYVRKVLSRRDEYRNGLRARPPLGGHVIAAGAYALPDGDQEAGLVGWGYRLHTLLSVGALGRLPRDESPLWILHAHLCLLDYVEGGLAWRAGSEEYVGSAALVSGNGKVRIAADADWEGDVRGGLGLSVLSALYLWASVGEEQAAAGAELGMGCLVMRYATGALDWDWGQHLEARWHRVGLSLGR